MRGACMTCCPTLVLIPVWITPKTEVTAATATMPETARPAAAGPVRQRGVDHGAEQDGGGQPDDGGGGDDDSDDRQLQR